MRNNLDAVEKIYSALGSPSKSLPSILVIGSNGKGTTAALIAAGLEMAGISSGLYTSPHLIHVEERIHINGYQINYSKFDWALEKIRETVEKEKLGKPTYFEATYLAAMLLFKHEKIASFVTEAGLGGRLDATRLSDPRTSVLTSLSLEHTQILGSSLEEIAHEKISAVPSKSALIYFEEYGTMNAIRSAGQRGVTLVPAQKIISQYCQNQIKGIAADLAYSALCIDYPEIEWKSYIMDAVKRLYWPARLEKRELIANNGAACPWWIDAAHNPAGMKMAAAWIHDSTFKRRCFIIGSSLRNDIHEHLKPISECFCDKDIVIIVEPKSGRNAPTSIKDIKDIFTQQCKGREINYVSAKCPNDALEIAKKLIEKAEIDLVASLGSLYLQGDLLAAAKIKIEGRLW